MTGEDIGGNSSRAPIKVDSAPEDSNVVRNMMMFGAPIENGAPNPVATVDKALSIFGLLRHRKDNVGARLRKKERRSGKLPIQTARRRVRDRAILRRDVGGPGKKLHPPANRRTQLPTTFSIGLSNAA